jgi:hypothetical protein
MTTIKMAAASEAETPERVKLVRKKNTKSIIWNYFGIPEQNTESSETNAKDPPTFCLTCKTQVANKGGNTSNLFTHLKQKHPVLHAEAIKCQESNVAASSKIHEKQPKLPNALPLPKLQVNSRESMKYHRAVGYHLAKDMVPIYTVEKPGFRHMMSVLNPRYEVGLH